MLDGLFGHGHRVNEPAYQYAQNTASGARRDASNAKTLVAELEMRVDRLSMACLGLWELLQERTDLTEEDLMQKVQEIDLRDGKLDGKVERGIVKCHKCGRTMSAKHNKCLYCGASEKNLGAFDAAL